MDRTFGQIVIESRRRAGMSQGRIAQLAGVSTNAISKIERDMIHPGPKLRNHISEILKIPKADLIFAVAQRSGEVTITLAELESFSQAA